MLQDSSSSPWPKEDLLLNPIAGVKGLPFCHIGLGSSQGWPISDSGGLKGNLWGVPKDPKQ